MVELTPAPINLTTLPPAPRTLVLRYVGRFGLDRRQLTDRWDRSTEKVQSSEPELAPGKTYVAVLPGHTRPAFVRRRRTPVDSAFGLTAVVRAFGPARSVRSSSVELKPQEVQSSPGTSVPKYFFAPPPPLPPPQLQLGYRQPGLPTLAYQSVLTTTPDQVVVAPTPIQEAIHAEQGFTEKIMTQNNRSDEVILQHTCASCGKFRSPSYHSRHPLAPREIPKPTICRKCIKESTSTDESEDSHQKSRKWDSRRARRKHRKYRGQHTASNKNSRNSPSSNEDIRIVRRSRSASRRPRSLSQSSSISATRIPILSRPTNSRRNWKQPSDDRVKIVERIYYLDRANEQPSRSRSLSRSQGSSPRQSWRYERPPNLLSPERKHVNSHNPTNEPVLQYRTIYYSYDDEHEEQHRRGRVRFHRRSVSMLGPNRTPLRLEPDDSFETPPRMLPERVTVIQPGLQRRYENDRDYENVPRRSPSRTVRTVRVSHGSPPRQASDRAWEESRPQVQEPRTTFVRKVSFDERSPTRHPMEPTEPRILRRRRERRIAEESSLSKRRAEYLPRGTMAFCTLNVVAN